MNEAVLASVLLLIPIVIATTSITLPILAAIYSGRETFVRKLDRLFTLMLPYFWVSWGVLVIAHTINTVTERSLWYAICAFVTLFYVVRFFRLWREANGNATSDDPALASRYWD